MVILSSHPLLYRQRADRLVDPTLQDQQQPALNGSSRVRHPDTVERYCLSLD
jgi:hypothetical protein